MSKPRESDSITCQALARQATEYLEERLAAPSHAEIENHLQTCNACRTYMNQMRQVRDSLRQLHDTQAEKNYKELTERFVRKLGGGNKQS